MTNIPSTSKLTKFFRASILMLMATSVGISSAIPNSQMLIPVFDTGDINKNRSMDFLAFKKHGVSKEVGIFDFVNENLIEIWSYKTPAPDVLVVGAAMGNFSGKNPDEILLLCSAEKENYLLLIENISDPSSNKKLKLKKNTNAVDIKAIKWGNQGLNAFVIIGGAPNRNLMIGRVKNQRVEVIQTISNQILSQSYGSIKITSGNIDKDQSNDLVAIINSNPSKIYQVKANGSFKPIITTSPRVQYIPDQLFDIDNDGLDDIVFTADKSVYHVNQSSTLRFPIDDNLVSLFKSNGELFGINAEGEIIKYNLGPMGLEQIHRSKSYFFSDKIDNIKSIFSPSFNHLVISHLGPSSEIAVEDLDFTINHQFQTLGGGIADVIVPAETPHYIPIDPEKANSFLFSSMKIDSIPEGMRFDIDSMRFEWTPLKSQLGFHSLFYETIYKQSGDITQESSKVSRKTISNQDTVSLLMYVNDPPKIYPKEASYTVVKNQPLKIKYQINDKNIDAIVSSRIIGSSMGASFISYIDSTKHLVNADSLTQGSNIETLKIDSTIVLSDSLSVVPDSLLSLSDTTLVSINADSSLVGIYNDINNKDAKKELYTEQLINHPSVIKRFAEFNWSPNVDPGSYIFTLASSDQIAEDSLNVAVNVHPVIDLSNNKKTFTATTNKEFNYLINIDQSPRSSSFTYKINEGPENVNVDKNGKVYWIPSINQVDTNNISIDVYDKHAKSTYKFSVYVNDPPYITSLIPTKHTINTNDTINHQMKFLDFNSNQSHIWNIEKGPSEMDINDKGVIKWIPNSLDFTDLTVSITDQLDTSFFKSTIYVNDIPKIVSNPTDIVNVGEMFSYQIDVIDNNKMHHNYKDNQPELNFSFLLKPNEMTITDSNLIEWIPSDSYLGWNEIQIIADDGLDSDRQEFSIFVNSIPNLSLDDSLSIAIGDTLLYNIQVEDINQEDKVLVTYNGDLNINIDNNKKTLRLIPNEKNIGLQTVELMASDSHPNSMDLQKMTVLIFTHPELVNLPPMEAFVGIQFSYAPIFIDMLGNEINEDGIQLTKATSKNMQLKKDPTSLDWTPDSTDVGLQSFEFQATDINGVKTSKFFEVETYLNPCPPCEVERKKKKNNIVKNYFDVELEKSSKEKSDSIQSNPLDTLKTLPDADSLQAQPTKIDSLQSNPVDTLKTLPDPDSLQVQPAKVDSLGIEPIKPDNSPSSQ